MRNEDLSGAEFPSCILQRPFSRRGVELLSVGFVEMGNFGNERILWIWIRQETTDTEKNLANGERGTPLILENVQADTALGVDIRMVYARGKGDSWRFEWIVNWKLNREIECTPRIWTSFGSDNGGCPGIEIVVLYGSSRTIAWWILIEIVEFAKYTFGRHDRVYTCQRKSVFVSIT